MQSSLGMIKYRNLTKMLQQFILTNWWACQDRNADDESQMGDETSHAQQDAVDPQTIIKASIKAMETMDQETRARWEDVNLRCLTLCIGTLERVNGVRIQGFPRLNNAAYLLYFLDLGRQLHLGWPAVRLGASCYLSETAGVARTRNDASRSYVPNLEGDRDLLTIVTGSNNECL